MEKKTVEVLEIVAPDNGIPFPIGFPVRFADGRAYWLAPAALGPKGKAISDAIAKIDATNGFEAIVSKFAALVVEALSANYKRETAEAIVESGIVNMSHKEAVWSCVLGTGPDYEVVAASRLDDDSKNE